MIKLNYKSILCHIYCLINNEVQIIKNSSLNLKTTKKTDDGFYYITELGISVQGCDANKCIHEIMNQAIDNDIRINMKVKLENKEEITINL